MRQFYLAALLAGGAGIAVAQYPSSLGVSLGGPRGGVVVSPGGAFVGGMIAPPVINRGWVTVGSPGFPGYVASAGVAAPALAGLPVLRGPIVYGRGYYPLPNYYYAAYPFGYTPVWRTPYYWGAMMYRGPLYYRSYPIRGGGWIRRR